jgi:integrative and conjugative element protein (TIGR02256 family)
MRRKYKLAEEALRFIVTESQERFPDETGGILVGKIEKQCVFIRHAIGPGENAHHSLHGFKRDGDYSQERLDEIVNKTNGEHDYLGEWHSHLACSRPSSTDIASMHWIVNNDDYAPLFPILLLCVLTKPCRWEILCYVMVKGRLRKLKPLVQPSLFL